MMDEPTPRQLAEWILADPEEQTPLSPYSSAKLSRAYLALQEQVEDQKDLLWVWGLAPTVKLDLRRTIREQRLEAERSA